jgi:hypothetical protein
LLEIFNNNVESNSNKTKDYHNEENIGTNIKVENVSDFINIKSNNVLLNNLINIQNSNKSEDHKTS